MFTNTDSLEVMSQAKRDPCPFRRFYLREQQEEPMEELSQARLKELLHYAPETGVFTRLVNRGGRARVGAIAGSKEAHGYWQIGVNGKNYKAHQLAWLYTYGQFPGEAIDHIDFDLRNNRIANLRLLSAKQHVEHRRHNKNNTSGLRGVCFCKMTGRWIAQIKSDYKYIWLGRFTTKDAAHAAYRQAAATYHSHNPEALA